MTVTVDDALVARLPIAVDGAGLRAWCARWQVTRLALFGSVLRADFGPESDVDVLVWFTPEARVRLGQLVAMEAELAELLQRKADLVEGRGVERSANPLRRAAILESAKVIYAAGV